ncbi:hypothetical protein BREV_BREV_03237 [Brevundimonas mediterranea]|uniref:Uncharacterized protein n=1 Tax=Brevundimonas mediterranea TaxID=74329 RepID=A0A7Z8Y0M2_9CAUL|nr:hypothetical protein BREV_BREV_03237 [Brevundimonas mediterranea]
MQRRGAQTRIRQEGGQNLKFQLQVLRAGGAAEAVAVRTLADAGVDDMAGQDAVGLIHRQLAQAAGVQHGVGGEQGREAVGGKTHAADARIGADQDLVIAEVGLLDVQQGPVGEADQGGAQIGHLGARGGNGRRAEVRIGPFQRRLIAGRGDGNLTRGLQRGGDGGLAALDRDRAGEQDQRPLAFEHRTHGGVDLFRRQIGDDLLELVQTFLGRGEDRVAIDGVQQGAGQGGGGAGRLRGHRILQAGAVFGDLALQLGGGDAVLGQTAGLLLGGLQRAFPFARREGDRQDAGVQAVE